MTEEPRNWDKELADIDRSIARQPSPPPPTPSPGAQPLTPTRRRFVALTWFWTGLALVLALGLAIWPFDKLCGIQLIFYLFAAGLALVIGVLGGLASWSHRRALAHALSLGVIAWATVLLTREVLPRVGYARQALTWTCPEEPPAAAPVPAPTGN
jgi:FtsH-binding integral membrane protein